MKTNKKKALITLAVMWVIAFVLIIGTKEKIQIDDKDIVTAFAVDEYVDTVGRVYAYVNYGNDYLDDMDRQELAQQITKALGIESDIELQIQRGQSDTSSSVTATYRCETENSKTDISIITIENASESLALALEQYILVDISIDNSVESAVYYKNIIEKFFAQNNIEADVSLSLKGSIEGALSNNRKNSICDSIISALNGKLITGSSSDELYTVYAYSESIDEYVVNGTTKSNINIAITYDKVEDISWVYIAIPLLDESY